MNWISQIVSFSVSLGFFLAVLIWFQDKSSGRRNRYFASLVFLITVQVWKDLWFIDMSPSLYLMIQGAVFFVGPMLLLYLNSMINQEQNSKRHVLVLLVPGILYIMLIGLIGEFLITNPEFQLWITPLKATVLLAAVISLQFGHLLYFLRLCYSLLQANEWTENMTIISLSKRINWLKAFVIGLTLVVVLIVAPNLIYIFNKSDDGMMYMKNGYSLVLSLLINYLAIRSFNKAEITFWLPQFKYGLSTMNIAAQRLIKEKLEQLMKEDQPFLRNDLKLEDLARMTAVQSSRLSQVLNNAFQKTFPEFVNGYRVEEAKRLLIQGFDQHQTIYDIAIDSGFNSKATFNRVFKNATGHTPTEFYELNKARK